MELTKGGIVLIYRDIIQNAYNSKSKLGLIYSILPTSLYVTDGSVEKHRERSSKSKLGRDRVERPVLHKSCTKGQ